MQTRGYVLKFRRRESVIYADCYITGCDICSVCIQGCVSVSFAFFVYGRVVRVLVAYESTSLTRLMTGHGEFDTAGLTAPRLSGVPFVRYLEALGENRQCCHNNLVRCNACSTHTGRARRQNRATRPVRLGLPGVGVPGLVGGGRNLAEAVMSARRNPRAFGIQEGRLNPH